jgi:hypothetical protein
MSLGNSDAQPYVPDTGEAVLSIGKMVGIAGSVRHHRVAVWVRTGPDRGRSDASS